jgi:hypothetical protein
MLIASASADGTVRIWEQQRAIRADDGLDAAAENAAGKEGEAEEGGEKVIFEFVYRI